jgi:hypothetical protein
MTHHASAAFILWAGVLAILALIQTIRELSL